MGTGIGDPQGAHFEGFRVGGCLSGPLNFDQLLHNVSDVFRYNFVIFCPFGASQSPERSFFIENQFYKFGFCKEVSLSEMPLVVIYLTLMP